MFLVFISIANNFLVINFSHTVEKTFKIMENNKNLHHVL